MLTVKQLIRSLRYVDKNAYVTIIVPYTVVPIYLEEVIASNKSTVTFTGMTPFESTTEEMIQRFGEENRVLITSAMEFMEKMVKDHDLKNFNYIEYIGNLLDHKAFREVDDPLEDPLEEFDEDYDFGPFDGDDDHFNTKKRWPLPEEKKVY